SRNPLMARMRWVRRSSMCSPNVMRVSEKKSSGSTGWLLVLMGAVSGPAVAMRRWEDVERNSFRSAFETWPDHVSWYHPRRGLSSLAKVTFLSGAYPKVGPIGLMAPVWPDHVREACADCADAAARVVGRIRRVRHFSLQFRPRGACSSIR